MKKQILGFEVELKEFKNNGETEMSYVRITGKNGKSIFVNLCPELDSVLTTTPYKNEFDISYMNSDDLGVVMIKGFEGGDRSGRE